MKVDLFCPVEVYNYELPTPEQPYCSLVLFNLAEKIVRSVQVSMLLFDAEGNPVTRRVERALGLAGESRELFEANIALEDADWVCSIETTIEKIWFDDATVWRRTPTPLQEYQSNTLPAGRVLDHLRALAGKDAVGFPADQGEVWVCVCGRANLPAELVCRRCERDRQQMFAQLTPVAVQTWIEERDRQQQEAAKRAREEATREEDARKAEQAKKRKKRRNRVAAAIATAVLAVAAYLFIVYGVPELRFRQAESLLASGSARRAKDVFLSLGTYRGADQRVRDTEFGIAMELVASEQVVEYEEGLRQLDAMTSYPQARVEAQKARLAEAEKAMDAGEYERAESLLTKVGEYENAPELLQDCAYQIASIQMNQGEYEAAAKRFGALGAYRDAATRAVDCVYRQAGKALEAKSYLKAASLYTSIPEYLDAVDRARDCVYQYALELKAEAKYEEAKKQFDKLGAYLDSADQGKECVYLPAKARMEAAAYAEAAELFAAIPGYLDSAELAKECVYLPAAAHFEKGEYQQAADLFKTITGYKDADAQAQKAAYQIAQQLLEGGKQDEAAEAFAALGDYDDAATRTLDARYQAAVREQEAGNYAQAQALFAALGEHSDAAARAKDCGYALAKALMDKGEWAAASEAFAALGEHSDAPTQANLCTYKRAEQIRLNNQLEESAALFASLGKFQDAMTQANATRYTLAERYEAAGQYALAGKTFAALGSYGDSGERSSRAYDTWLADIQRTVDAAMGAGNYAQVMNAIEQGVTFADLPEQYAGLEEAYYKANLEYAKQLIASGNSLPAYPYLQRVSGQKEARTLLKDHIFMILGTWASADGSVAEFRANGTCAIDGQEKYFNVDGYGVMVGDSPMPQKRTHAIVLLDEKKLTLQRESDATTVKYSRVASPDLPVVAVTPASTPAPGQ